MLERVFIFVSTVLTIALVTSNDAYVLSPDVVFPHLLCTQLNKLPNLSAIFAAEFLIAAELTDAQLLLIAGAGGWRMSS